MVTTVLNGGLGNQMFQVAVAYALAKDNEDECAFNFERPVINQGNPASGYRKNLYSKLKELPLEWKPNSIYKETKFNYKKIPYRDNLRLEGYFQSDKYFKRCKTEIIDLFLNDNTVCDVLCKLWRKYYKLLCGHSVSIHVRRGDYLKFQDIHTNLGTRYYNKALNYLMNRVEVSNILIFSDDIDWCKKNLTYRHSLITYISDNDDYEDLLLMSLCKHNIIANSSFSWWGAYLNKNSDKIVIAPRRWFGVAFNEQWGNIYTKRMIVL